MNASGLTTGADITALVAMLRHIQCEPASFDTYSMASAAERAADAIERLSLSATTAADISPDAVEQLAQALEQELDPVVAGILRALRSALTASGEDAARYLEALQWIVMRVDDHGLGGFIATECAARARAAMEKANGWETPPTADIVGDNDYD